MQFLSTLSLRRATLYVIIVSLSDSDFYPRSPCGERRDSGAFLKDCANFYPRSPCGERHQLHYNTQPDGQFLSTLSLRRATPNHHKSNHTVRGISIHALLAESDRSRKRTHNAFWYFYPRSPCGERLKAIATVTDKEDFYPRSPCGERRHAAPLYAAPPGNFYPRSPCGERRFRNSCRVFLFPISIHALLAESDHNL